MLIWMTIHDKSFLLSETQGGFNLFLMFLSTHCSTFLTKPEDKLLFVGTINLCILVTISTKGNMYTLDRKLINMESLDDTQLGCCHRRHTSLAFVGSWF